MMISGATYKNGIAIDSDGAVYIFGVAGTGGSLPAGSTQCKGSEVNGGKVVDADGRLVVVFV
jgi:hypothetical protein